MDTVDHVVWQGSQAPALANLISESRRTSSPPRSSQRFSPNHSSVLISTSSSCNQVVSSKLRTGLRGRNSLGTVGAGTTVASPPPPNFLDIIKGVSEKVNENTKIHKKRQIKTRSSTTDLVGTSATGSLQREKENRRSKRGVHVNSPSGSRGVSDLSVKYSETSPSTRPSPGSVALTSKEMLPPPVPKKLSIMAPPPVISAAQGCKQDQAQQDVPMEVDTTYAQPARVSHPPETHKSSRAPRSDTLTTATHITQTTTAPNDRSNTSSEPPSSSQPPRSQSRSRLGMRPTTSSTFVTTTSKPFRSPLINCGPGSATATPAALTTKRSSTRLIPITPSPSSAPTARSTISPRTPSRGTDTPTPDNEAQDIFMQCTDPDSSYGDELPFDADALEETLSKYD